MEHSVRENQEHEQAGVCIAPMKFGTDGVPSHMQGSDDQLHVHRATVAHCVAQGEYSLTESLNKPPSPEHSSGPTTGTTSTPTSCENAPSSDDANERATRVPQFPRESLQNESSWRSTQFYGSGQTPQQQLEGQQQILHQHGYQQHARHPTHGQSPQRYNPANYPSAIKLLVSNNVAASIIGRAGHTISELQSQSKTRIKLSQAGDFFPGTQDRVCLIQGETENVKAALRLIAERLYVLQEHQYMQHMSWQMQKPNVDGMHAFDFVIRLLVPTTSCGMIIGKSGSNIKFMEESTGVSSVRLSPKDAIDAGYPTSIATVTNERIVTVTAPTLDPSVHCILLILDNMASHPEISRYTNLTTSYARLVPESFPGSGGHPVTMAPVHPRHTPSQDPWSMPNPFPYSQTSIQRRFVSAPDLAGVLQSQQDFHSHQVQRSINVPVPASPERSVIFAHDHAHGSSYPSSAFGPSFSSFAFPAHQPSGPTLPQATLRPRLTENHTIGSSSAFPVHHSHSAPDLLAIQLDQSLRISNQPLPITHQELTQQPVDPTATRALEGFVPQAPVLTAPGCFIAQALVPEQIVGSILGLAGAALTELQMLTGTRIRVSQRGEYMPGTRSRIVTIRGPSAQSVWQAQHLMSQRIIIPTTAVHPSSIPASLANGLGLSTQADPVVNPVSPTRDDNLVDHEQQESRVEGSEEYSEQIALHPSEDSQP